MPDIQQCQPLLPGELSQPFLSLSISSSFGRVNISQDKREFVYTSWDEYSISFDPQMSVISKIISNIFRMETILF